MTKNLHRCDSCGMTIESGPYCQYCVDADGGLQDFTERFSRMTQFLRRQDPTATAEAVARKILEYMATMPAWRNHPELLARLGK